MRCESFCVFFFFQAEDGIRDHCVTGVQTCALPISAPCASRESNSRPPPRFCACARSCSLRRDRKSTRLNSSHTVISYAVFCLKKKNRTDKNLIVSAIMDFKRLYICTKISSCISHHH